MPFRNSYTLLAQFLNPVLGRETEARLFHAARTETIAWNTLLFQANLQVVTPLWYLSLRRNKLLDSLPTELIQYIAELHAANLDRNAVFADALVEVLEVCQKEGFSPILLKGAASFADDLYGDPGARMQSDLDIMLPPEQAPVLSEWLRQIGYQYFEKEPPHWDNQLPTPHHHHLKMLTKPGTPVVLEIHYRVTSGRIGEVFKEATTIPAKVAGLDCQILSSEWRDMHNLLHAMVKDRGSLTSLVPLKAAAESAWLRHRYPDADYDGLAKVAETFGCGHDYRLYRAVSERLGLWSQTDESAVPVSTFRINRCLDHGGSLTKESKPRLLTLYLSLYKKLHFPRWAWNYLCYLDSSHSTWDRLKKMVSYIRRPSSWKNI